MLIEFATILALITAIIHIRAEYRGPRWQVYVFKPATTLLLIGIVAVGALLNPAPFRYLLLAGMIFCLGGDVFLMLPPAHFLKGLVSFLIGHLFYIAGFVAVGGGGLAPLALPPLLLLAYFMLRRLNPHLGSMKVPVWVYMAVILVMAWQAWAWWGNLRGTAALLAALGATLFVISDSVLALDRFARPFPAARLIVLGTYYAAQWLIAAGSVS